MPFAGLNAAVVRRRVVAAATSIAVASIGAVALAAPASAASTPTMTVSAQATGTPGSQVLVRATVTCPVALASATTTSAAVTMSGYSATAVGSTSDGAINAPLPLTGAAGSATLTGSVVELLPSADTYPSGATANAISVHFSGVTGCAGSLTATGSVTVAPSALAPGFDTSHFDTGAVDSGGAAINRTTGSCDDCSEHITLPFAVSIAGQSYSSVYVNNNGLLSFTKAVSAYVGVTFPAPASLGYGPLIAPYWADADTRPATTTPPKNYTNCINEGVAKWGPGTYDGESAWGATWTNVGSYPQGCAHVGSFQVLLVSTPEVDAGAFKIVYNYGTLGWKAGSVSGAALPQPGYDTGDGVHFTNLDAGIAGGAQGLSFANNGTGVPGRFELSSKIPPILSWATPQQITYGTPLTATQLNATSTSPGTFSYNPPIGTVLSGGDHTLTATFTSSDNTIANGQVSVTLPVSAATPTVSWSAPAAITYGTPLGAAQLNATASVPGSFAYTVDSNTSSASGQVLHAGAGQLLDVTFTPDDTTDYLPVSTSVPITVSQAAQAITFAPLGSHSFGDAPFTVHATGGGSGQPVTFSVANGAHCALSDQAGGTDSSGNGTGSATVTLTGAGGCAITAQQAGTSDYLAAPDVLQSATIAQATPTITWPAPDAITYGTAIGGAQLDAHSNVPGTFSYTYDAGNGAASGAVLSAGSHTLTVVFTPTDTANYTSATSTVTLQVNRAPQAISFDALPDRTFGVAPFALDASGGASSSPITFAVTGPCQLSYTDSSAILTVLGAGDCSVTASQDGDENYDPADPVTRTFTVHKATPQLGWSDPQDIGYGTPLSETQLDASSNVVGDFAYTADGGTGDATGAVLHAGTHTLHATFTPSDTADYTSANIDASLTVTPATPQLSWTPTTAAIVYGTPLGDGQLDATADVAGAFSYDPAAGAVLHAGARTLHATFTPSDATDYTSADVTTTITVNQAPQTVSFDAVGNHTWGDAPFTVNATGGASGNAVTFTAADACQVGNAGSGTDGAGNGTGQVTVTLTGAGGCTLTASQAGNADYLTAPDATQSFSIAKATPAITWPTPNAITYGAALGAAQLDASATTPGTFAYTVDGGTVDATGQKLHAGQHTLSVTFTPADSGNYTGATASVTLMVTQASQSITFGALPSRTVGDAPFALTAVGGASGNPVTYAVQDGSSCTVDSSTATVTLTGAGTCTITASQAGNGDYADAVPVTQSFVIGKAPSVLHLAAIADHSYGDAPFRVTVTGSGSTSPITLTAAPAGVCVLSSGNLITLTGPGTCTVTANQAGDANYQAAAPVSQSFSVSYRVAVLTDLSKAVHQNATLPVKIQLTSSTGANLSSATVTVHAVGIDATTIAPAPGSSQPGQNFTYSSGSYQYNVKTTTLSAGQHTLTYTAGNDPTKHTVTFTVTS